MAKSRSLSRRAFLKLISAAGAGLFLDGCQPKETVAPPAPATLSPEPTETPTSAPPRQPETPTKTPVNTATSPPTSTPTNQPTSTPTPIPLNTVSTGRVESYDPALVRAELERMVLALGGFEGLVKPGARVGIKVNLTGGTWWDTPDKPPATELFVTHPAVVGALSELISDAGASQIIVMDGLGDERSYDAWGYTAMAEPLGLSLIDLCKPDPYPGWGIFQTGSQAQVYPQFYLNQVLSDIDVLISVAKLKVHSVSGVTLALKNLFGIAPISEYRRSADQNHRSWFHGNSNFDTRLPRVIIDLNLACPVHFAVIDGIYSGEAGTGPWDPALTQVKPGVLLAGRDPVAVDAVSTAVMGFDPEANSGDLPFTHCENYLALAREAGLGTHLLSEIPVVGPPIAELLFPFVPVG